MTVLVYRAGPAQIANGDGKAYPFAKLTNLFVQLEDGYLQAQCSLARDRELF